METGASNAVHFPDNPISEEQLENSQLSLIQTRDAVSYCITGVDGTVLTVGRAPSNDSNVVLSSICSNELFTACTKASLSVSTNHFSITSRNSEPSDALVFKLHSGSQVSALRSFDLTRHDARLIEPVAQDASKIFHEQFPFGKEYSHRALLIDSMLRKSSGPSSMIYALVSESYVDIYVVKDGGLLLANSFDIKTATDVLYFILNVAEQMSLPDFEVQLSGQVDVRSDILKLCKEHCASVSIHFGFDYYKMSPELSGVKKQHFSELFNLARCVS